MLIGSLSFNLGKEMTHQLLCRLFLCSEVLKGQCTHLFAVEMTEAGTQQVGTMKKQKGESQKQGCERS